MTLTRRALLAAPAGLAAQTPKRPNILWLSCEDTGPEIRCYGNPDAITPNIDRLAAQGTRFTRAFTVAGVCAPSRSGIITGMHPCSLGSQHMRSNIVLPPNVKAFPELLRAAGYYCSNNVKTDYNFPTPAGAWDDSSPNAHWKNRKPGQPFFAVFNNVVSHESQLLKRGAEHEANVKRLRPADRQDPSKVTIPPYYPDTPEVRRDWANYLELVTAVDYWVGDHLRELAEAGLENETIVFFWGDHGVGLPRAKRFVYDSGTLAPLIVRIPGQKAAIDGRLVSFLDLGPTVLNLAGVPLPAHFQGQPFLGPKLPPPRQYVYSARDRMDERYDIIRSVRDARFRYVRNYEPEKPFYQEIDTQEGGVTMKELRRLHRERKLPPAAEQFMAPSKPREELYDAEADPHHLKNLAGDPAHARTLGRFRRELVRWQNEILDTGLIPEPELEAGERKYGSRYAILRAPENKGLLGRLREAADGHGSAGDRNASVRWWAAKRLSSVDEAQRLLKDESAAVRVAAASALARLGREDLALPVLIAILEGKEQAARVFAATALEEMGPRALPAKAALQATQSEPRNSSYTMRVAKHALEKMSR
jgi:uncharacterized sulfatase